jgi:hypothetical protein
MDTGPLTGTVPFCDLDPVNPYYACGPTASDDYTEYFVWAETVSADGQKAVSITARATVGLSSDTRSSLLATTLAM